MSKSENAFLRRRIEAVAGLLLLGFVMLALRAVDLQLLQGDELKARADKQRQRLVTMLAPRGKILDAQGRILAESLQVPSLAVVASELPPESLPRLARALDMKASALRKKLAGRSGFVWLARQTSPETADEVMALNLPGVRQQMEWRRYYPYGPETGHVLGFVGVDGHGLEGLEVSRDEQLRGSSGHMQIKRDARGHLLPGGDMLEEPRMGADVQLYLDANIQSLAYAALVDGVKRHKAKGGSVVVMRPADGAVLAMASWPAYNPNNFRRYKPGQWRNRAITDVLEPGSVLKPFTVAAALQTDRWQPESLIHCENGRFTVANYTIHDEHPEAWLDLSGLLARSSNIGASKLALDVGAETLRSTLRAVGFGSRPGSGLIGESPGLMPPEARWGPVETATIGFGQGIAVTPLQLATALSVLANDGMAVSPKLMQGQATTAKRRVLPENVARSVMRMLEKATSAAGTGSSAVPVGYRVAGKTGTAQKPVAGGYAEDRYTAVFAGVVPAEQPELVIVVVIDEPRDTIYGGAVAAPIFRTIAASSLSYLGVYPSAPEPRQPRLFAVAAGDSGMAGHVESTAPRLYGATLRELRRVAMRGGYRLRVHGSGWLVKQQPAAWADLPPGGLLEVWLDD
ncbi:MAG: penicillin-binding protein 2 [Mariprofundaceae bacterium]